MGQATSLDWSREMAQEWSWVRVDPATWQDAAPLDSVASASVRWDRSTKTLLSGTLEVDGGWPGEFWVRGYLDAEQDGRSERVCVATMLCQTPTREAGSAVGTLRVDCYGPLLELDDEVVGVGWSLPAGSPVLPSASAIARNLCRAPLVAPLRDSTSLSEPWVAEDGDTALDVASSLVALAGHELSTDPWGRTCVEPALRTAALAPVATLTDSEVDGIVLAPVTERADWYKLPNAVEAVWSEQGRCLVAVAVNDDPSSPLSTVARGRRVVRRLSNPEGLSAGCSQEAVDAVARSELAEASALERTCSYTRGFDPRIGIGDCVRLDLPSLGVGCVGRVTRQEVDCSTGATVAETVTWTERMWVPR